MMREAAHREGEVGPKFVPEPKTARVARGFFLCFHAAELDAGRPLRGVARQSGSLEVVRAQLNVTPEFLVHLALERRAAENVTHFHADTIEECCHTDSGVASSAAVMPATTCSQLERSAR